MNGPLKTIPVAELRAVLGNDAAADTIIQGVLRLREQTKRKKAEKHYRLTFTAVIEKTVYILATSPRAAAEVTLESLGMPLNPPSGWTIVQVGLNDVVESTQEEAGTSVPAPSPASPAA